MKSSRVVKGRHLECHQMQESSQGPQQILHLVTARMGCWARKDLVWDIPEVLARVHQSHFGSSTVNFDLISHRVVVVGY